MTILTVVQYLFLAYAGWSLIVPIKERRWKRYWTIFVRRSPGSWAKVLAETLLVLLAVSVIGFLIYRFGGPVARFSWLQLISTPAERQQPKSLIGGGMSVPLVGIGFLLLLALNMPRLARWEESVFRVGTRDMKHAVLLSLRFGLAHFGIGLPIAYCLALWIPGMWLSRAYLQHGIRESTWKHATYNLAIALLVLYFLVS